MNWKVGVPPRKRLQTDGTIMDSGFKEREQIEENLEINAEHPMFLMHMEAVTSFDKGPLSQTDHVED